MVDIDEILRQKEESDRLHAEALEAVRRKYAPQEKKPRAPKKTEGSKDSKNKEQLKYFFILLGLLILGLLALYWLA